MSAFPAAKRALYLVISALLILSVPVAQAADDSESDKSGYLGVMLQDIGPSMAKALQLDGKTGVLIREVVEDSPAEKAGLEDGDVIIAFEGKSLEDYAGLTQAVRSYKPGTEVDVTVIRAGKKKDVKVELGERDDDFSWTVIDDGDLEIKLPKMLKDGDHAWHFEHGEDFEFPEGKHGNLFVKRLGDGEDMEIFFGGSDRGFLGIHPTDLNEQLGEYFGVKNGEGVLVEKVVDDSPAAEAGLKAGDVIVKLDGEDIVDSGELHAFMADTEKDQKVKVEYVRKGKSGKADVTLGEAPEIEISEDIRIFGDGAHDMHFKGPKHMKVERQPHGDRKFEVIRELHGDHGDLDELRDELHEMRQELKELKKELKK